MHDETGHPQLGVNPLNWTRASPSYSKLRPNSEFSSTKVSTRRQNLCPNGQACEGILDRVDTAAMAVCVQVKGRRI